MYSGEPLFSKETSIILDTCCFAEIFSNSIERGSEIERVYLNKIKLTYQNEEVDFESFNFEKLIHHQIRPLDFAIYINQKRLGVEMTWVKRKVEDETDYTEADYNFACFYAYFMLMTRDKVKLDHGENVPNFLKRVNESDFKIEKVLKLLSENNIDLMIHNWIFDINVSNLGDKTTNRLFKGLAGMRYMQAITQYPIKENTPQKFKNMVQNLKEKINKNIYKEAHSIGQPQSIKNIGLSKNLNNFILDFFDQSSIEQMVKNKHLRSKPQRIIGANDYLNWNEDFFSYLQTPLIKGISESKSKITEIKPKNKRKAEKDVDTEDSKMSKREFSGKPFEK